MAKKLAKWLIEIFFNLFLFTIVTSIVAFIFYSRGLYLQTEKQIWLAAFWLLILGEMLSTVMEKVWKRVWK